MHQIKPILLNVIYYLFPTDIDSVSNNLLAHTIDREICLVFSDGSNIYISWHTDPVTYCIGFKTKSFFINDNYIMKDMTGTELWKNAVGREISLNFLDSEHQVLEITTNSHSVFCSSFENSNWFKDVISITKVNSRL